jgi:hypothetical protein
LLNAAIISPALGLRARWVGRHGCPLAARAYPHPQNSSGSGPPIPLRKFCGKILKPQKPAVGKAMYAHGFGRGTPYSGRNSRIIFLHNPGGGALNGQAREMHRCTALATQPDDPNAQLLAETRINEYPRRGIDDLDTSLQQVSTAINAEADKRIKGAKIGPDRRLCSILS